MSPDTVQDKPTVPRLDFTPNILTFHNMTPELTLGVNNYSPKRFEKLIEFLSEAGYEFVSLDEALKGGGGKKIAVTFDDGYQHLYKTLPPIIERYALKPTVFIPAGYIGKANDWDYSSLLIKEYHLNREEIGELAGAGVKFGSHGLRHRALNQLDEKQIDEELVQSKAILEDITGHSVDCLSYPFGRYNNKVIDRAVKAGYKYAFTMAFPRIGDNILRIGRMAVYSFDTHFTIFQKIARGPVYPVQNFTSRVINGLSQGTVLLNRLRGLV